jgi:hypothetical protein
VSILFKVSTLADALAADAELTVQRPGWAVMRARPNFKEHGQVLWADLLEALGHEVSSSLRGRAGSRSESLAFCWLAAGAVSDLVVAGAHLHPPRSLIDLCTMTTATGVRTWLLYDIESCDEREEAELNLALTTEPLARFLEVRQSCNEVQRVASAHPFPAVPDVHFLGFLDAVGQVLSQQDAEVASRTFRAGRDHMKERLTGVAETDENGLAMHLHEITAHTNDLNELTALVKGAQTGSFACGWYARVDIPKWAQRGMVAGLSLHLDDSDWERLAHQHRPHEGATCVLSTLGFSVDAMPGVRASEVADDGSSVIKGGVAVEVPAPARHLLVAQHIYRALIGAETDRFLVQGPKEPEINDKWAGRLLRVVTQDTGVVLRGWHASRKGLDGTGWTHRLGVAMTRLAS